MNHFIKNPSAYIYVQKQQILIETNHQKQSCCCLYRRQSFWFGEVTTLPYLFVNKKSLLLNKNFGMILCFSLIHSGHFYSAPSSTLLLRGAPDYSTYSLLYRSFTPKRTGNCR